ncbi:MAG: molecular chaperone DnaK [Myxococcales bacterium FL481]|nr:MAG: molecular chaperone DnaK [Myxococcales bacterium FL481]
MSDSGPIIGIDLGTTNSCVAVAEGDKVTIIANSEGSRTTPSVVAVTEDGQRLVGQIAKRQALTNPENTVYAAKRLIGRKLGDPELAAATRGLPYQLVAAQNGDAHVAVWDRQYSPAEIGASVLGKMREAAETHLGQAIERAVITVPAYFNDAQRQATKDAGRIAGLNVERIINEPTAATLAYGVGRQSDGEIRTVAVYDLGGGTFDISLLELRDGAFEVLATAGDTFLGGEDFDEALIDWAAETFLAEHGIDLRAQKLSRQRLKEAVEKAKHELSFSVDTEINLPFIAAKDGAPIHMISTLTRQKLEELTSGLVDRTLEPCRQALEDAGLSVDDIDEVLLVGGQSRMPLVAERVKGLFGREASKGVNPDEVVAAGAAIQGAVLDGRVKSVVLLDVAPLNIGVETAGGVFTTLIPKGTTIPTRKSEVFSTSVDNQPVVPVHVLQGLREMAEDNTSLAQLELRDLPPAPRGVPQIKVSFDIDADGILSVGAEDLGTRRSVKMTVQPASGLTEERLEQLANEAKGARANDVLKRELAELKNRGETLLYTCGRSLETFADGLGEAHRAEIEQDMDRLRTALESTAANPQHVREALTTLENSSHQIYEAMLAQTEGESGTGSSG